MEHDLKFLFQELKDAEKKALLKPKEFEQQLEYLLAKYSQAKDGLKKER